MVNAMIEVICTVLVGLAGSIATNAYYYGKLTQKVSDHSDDIEKLQVDVKDHGTRIATLEGRVGM